MADILVSEQWTRAIRLALLVSGTDRIRKGEEFERRRSV